MSLRKQIRPRNTLAFRLTLWYAGIFAITSCIAFLLFYARITTLIWDQTDQELLGQRTRFSILLESEGPDAVKDSAVVEAQAAGVRKVFFRFLSMDGQVFSSSNMSYWKDIDIDESAVKTLLRENGPIFQTISMTDRKEKVRVLYSFLGPSVILQVGVVMESYSHFLDAFQGIFILTMTFLIVLAAGVGWFLARRAVSGVESITRTAQKISGGTLDQRVPVQKRGDEIDQLASTFNKMLDRIQALLAEIKEMNDNIAHDLRSPIARIRGIAEITLTNSKTLNEFESMAASTIEECDRLLDMINTMLIISKTESGVSQVSYEEVNLSDIVRRACELFEPMAEDKGLALSCTVPNGTYLMGDTPMIQRMLSNLIDNAIKYTPMGGRVDIDVSENPFQGIVVVRDTGIGISAAEVPRIFERFYRCDQSRSQAGIGLGLSLARAIARAHGGDITVNSVSDQGSTFTVTLSKSFSPQTASLNQ
jgi:heavy metal sensor kinase